MSQVRFAMTFTHKSGEGSPATVTAFDDGTVSITQHDVETVLSDDGPPVTEQECVDMLEELVEGLADYELTGWNPK